MILAIRRKANELLAEYRHAEQSAADESAALEAASVRVQAAEQAQRILQEIAQTVQQSAHTRIASVVTRCLQAVFGDDAYSLKIDFRQSRGKTEAVLLFCRDGHEIDPTEASGGGCIDVASLALRISCLILSQPQRRRVLILDEPFRFLSKEHTPKIREMLLTLAKELKVQFVLVTHDVGLQAGTVIEIGE